MSDREKSVDYWVEELTKDTDPELFALSDDDDDDYETLTIRSYSQWLLNCGYNEGLADLQTKVNTYCIPQWISVKDRLPEVGEHVLVFSPVTGIKNDFIAFVENPEEYRFFLSGRVTHWMPLPALPKENNDD